MNFIGSYTFIFRQHLDETFSVCAEIYRIVNMHVDSSATTASTSETLSNDTYLVSEPQISKSEDTAEDSLEDTHSDERFSDEEDEEDEENTELYDSLNAASDKCSEGNDIVNETIVKETLVYNQTNICQYTDKDDTEGEEYEENTEQEEYEENTEREEYEENTEREEYEEDTEREDVVKCFSADEDSNHPWALPSQLGKFRTSSPSCSSDTQILVPIPIHERLSIAPIDSEVEHQDGGDVDSEDDRTLSSFSSSTSSSCTPSNESEPEPINVIPIKVIDDENNDVACGGGDGDTESDIRWLSQVQMDENSSMSSVSVIGKQPVLSENSFPSPKFVSNEMPKVKQSPVCRKIGSEPSRPESNRHRPRSTRVFKPTPNRNNFAESHIVCRDNPCGDGKRKYDRTIKVFNPDTRKYEETEQIELSIPKERQKVTPQTRQEKISMKAIQDSPPLSIEELRKSISKCSSAKAPTITTHHPESEDSYLGTPVQSDSSKPQTEDSKRKDFVELNKKCVKTQKKSYHEMYQKMQALKPVRCASPVKSKTANRQNENVDQNEETEETEIDSQTKEIDPKASVARSTISWWVGTHDEDVEPIQTEPPSKWSPATEPQQHSTLRQANERQLTRQQCSANNYDESQCKSKWQSNVEPKQTIPSSKQPHATELQQPGTIRQANERLLTRQRSGDTNQYESQSSTRRQPNAEPKQTIPSGKKPPATELQHHSTLRQENERELTRPQRSAVSYNEETCEPLSRSKWQPLPNNIPVPSSGQTHSAIRQMNQTFEEAYNDDDDDDDDDTMEEPDVSPSISDKLCPKRKIRMPSRLPVFIKSRPSNETPEVLPPVSCGRKPQVADTPYDPANDKKNYKPYTMKDYKNLRLDIRLGGLGPQANKNVVQEKLKKYQRQANYAQQVMERNRKRLLTRFDKPEVGKCKEEIRPTSKAIRRQKAMEYAKKIQRPMNSMETDSPRARDDKKERTTLPPIVNNANPKQQIHTSEKRKVWDTCQTNEGEDGYLSQLIDLKAVNKLRERHDKEKEFVHQLCRRGAKKAELKKNS